MGMAAWSGGSSGMAGGGHPSICLSWGCHGPFGQHWNCRSEELGCALCWLCHTGSVPVLCQQGSTEPSLTITALPCPRSECGKLQWKRMKMTWVQPLCTGRCHWCRCGIV